MTGEFAANVCNTNEDARVRCLYIHPRSKAVFGDLELFFEIGTAEEPNLQTYDAEHGECSQ